MKTFNDIVLTLVVVVVIIGALLLSPIFAAIAAVFAIITLVIVFGLFIYAYLHDLNIDDDDEDWPNLGGPE